MWTFLRYFTNSKMYSRKNSLTYIESQLDQITLVFTNKKVQTRKEWVLASLSTDFLKRYVSIEFYEKTFVFFTAERSMFGFFENVPIIFRNWYWISDFFQKFGEYRKKHKTSLLNLKPKPYLNKNTSSQKCCPENFQQVDHQQRFIWGKILNISLKGCLHCIGFLKGHKCKIRKYYWFIAKLELAYFHLQPAVGPFKPPSQSKFPGHENYLKTVLFVWSFHSLAINPELPNLKLFVGYWNLRSYLYFCSPPPEWVSVWLLINANSSDCSLR